MSAAVNRVPEGVPAGGQFAGRDLPETGTTLEVDPLLSDTLDLSPGERAAALAIDGAALGDEIGAVVTYEADGISGCPTVSFTRPGAWTVVSIFPFRDPKPYLVQTFTEDVAVTGPRRGVTMATGREVLDKIRRDLGPW